MSTSTDSQNRHIIRVAPKSLNILLHPLKQQHLILQPNIQNPLLFTPFRRQESKSTNPIIETHSNHRLRSPSHQIRDLSPMPVPRVKSTPMKAYQHRKLLLLPQSPPRAPNIQIQTVLTLYLVIARRRRTPLPEPRSIKFLCRSIDRNRRFEAILTTSGFRKWNPEEFLKHLGTALLERFDADDLPLTNLHTGSHTCAKMQVLTARVVSE